MTHGGGKKQSGGAARETSTRAGLPWWRSPVAAVGAGVLVVAGVLAWALWPEPAQPRSRQYRDVVACLLTDDRGINGREAAEVWAGMQSASLQTLARAQYLSVEGEQNAQNARAYLNSQVQSGCVMILAVGKAPREAVELYAADHPAMKFVVFGPNLAQDKPNVAVLEPSRAAVQSAVIEKVGPDQR